MKKKIIFTLLIVCIMPIVCLANGPIQKKKGREHFVKQTMEQMSLKEMVGQLIMIGSDSDITPSYVDKIMQDIDSNKVGGVCFFKGKSENVPVLIEKYNSLCRIPLLVSIDGEWGLAMRLSDITPFARAMTLGAINQDSYELVYKKGAAIAKQCKLLGIHINFAPDVDINLNPANPVINTRSFGQDKEKVALLAYQYAKGMQDNGIMAVIKHFPGHGDTDIDSHSSLPTINHDKAFIDSVDIYPFRYNIEKGVWGAMIGHLNVPALSPESSLPASINHNIINDYLIDELNFKGLIFTDAMNMKGLTNDYPDGQAQVLALKAGVDVLLMPANTTEAVNAICKAVEEGVLSEKLIREKCKKVLRWKYDLGVINQSKTIKNQNGTLAKQNAVSAKQNGVLSDQIAEINQEIKALNQQIANQAITLLKSNNVIMPLKPSQSNHIAVIALDDKPFDHFDSVCRTFQEINSYCIGDKADDATTDSILNQANNADIIITLLWGGVNQTKKNNYGLGKTKLQTIQKIQSLDKNNILVLLANPYCLESLDTIDNYDGLVVGYQNTAELQIAVANALFGKGDFNGSLPVSGSEKYPVGSGKEAQTCVNPYQKVIDMGMKQDCFEKIDSIILKGLEEKAYPGAQVLIAKDGEIVFERSVGFQTYENTTPITDSSLFDLASLTKVMATTLAVMKLYEEDKFSLDDKLSDYLPYLKKTNKSKITIREALSHIARLKAFLPIWKYALEDAKKQSDLFAKQNDETASYVQVCDSLFVKKEYSKTIRKQIAASPLGEKHQYVYSDLGFIMLADLVEAVSGKTLDTYLEETFYQPMGLNHTCFNPLSHNQNPDNIVPTIEAVDFRKTKLKGFVHDETAALNGGVAGHAGLFSTTKDLFALCQMLLNKGTYNQKRYLKEETIETFNHRYYKKYDNRRALGFDKPLIHSKSRHCSEFCSPESFGHSGFTGTYLWIEPENGTIFIFLSNRVYPDASVNKLAQMNIRTDIQDLIYQSLQKEEE